MINESLINLVYPLQATDKSVLKGDTLKVKKHQVLTVLFIYLNTRILNLIARSRNIEYQKKNYYYKCNMFSSIYSFFPLPNIWFIMTVKKILTESLSYFNRTFDLLWLNSILKRTLIWPYIQRFILSLSIPLVKNIYKK